MKNIPQRNVKTLVLPASIILCRTNAVASLLMRSPSREITVEKLLSDDRVLRMSLLAVPRDLGCLLLILLSHSPSSVSSWSVSFRKTPNVTRKKPLSGLPERIPSEFLYFLLRLSRLLFTYPRVRPTGRRKSQNSMRNWLARAIVRGPPIVLETLSRKEIQTERVTLKVEVLREKEKKEEEEANIANKIKRGKQEKERERW